MAKPSDRSPERKLQVVLSVLRGELTGDSLRLAQATADKGVMPPTI